MLEFNSLILIFSIAFICSIPVTILSVPPKVSANSEVQWTPKKFKNSSYIVMTFMRDIGYPDFFEYENIDNCFKNDDYNFHFYYSCYIKKDDIIEFTFKKELNNLDSFLSNNRSIQIEYLFSIDLSKMLPIIKDVTSMNFMFKGCKNLKYINFGNFDASKVTSMISMFEGCTSLISLNLSNFDTSNVIHMSRIFNNLISLKILDISNFNMEKVINYNDMFCNLTELRYINIYNYKNDKNKTICNTFKNNENLIVCQNEKIISNPNFIYKCCNFDIENDNCNNLQIKTNTSSFIELNSEKNKNIKWPKQKPNLKKQKTINNNFLTYRKINDEKIGIIILGFDFYDVNNLTLSIDYYFVSTNNNINFKYLKFSCLIKYNNSVSGIISIQTKEVNCIFENTMVNNKYKIPCYVKLDNMSYMTIEPIHESFIIEPDNFEIVGVSPIVHFYNYTIIENLRSSNKSVYILDHSLYSKKPKNSKYFNITGIINESYPNITYNDLILYVNDLDIEENVEKLNCNIINDNKNNYTLICQEIEPLNISLQSAISFINENGDILLIKLDEKAISPSPSSNICSGIDFFNEICTPNNITDSSDIVVSDFIYDILDDIEDGKFNDIFNEIIAENTTINKSENNVTYQISTVSSQYISNLSTVALEDCETKLKEKYSLDKNEKLILLKVDYGIEKIKIPIIEYQLFLKNGTRLNLSYCDNIPEIISIPVNINEEEEFIHNPNSDFYDDRCYVYTSEYNTDLTVYDRKKNYNEKYYALCEKNCKYREYNNKTKRVECECRTKNEFPKFAVEANEINKELNLKDLLHQFTDVIKHSNLFLFKCYKVVFSSEGLKNNSGSYIIIIFTFAIIFCTIYFGIKGFTLYKRNLKKMISQKNQNIIQQVTTTSNINTSISDNSKNPNNTDTINYLNNLYKKNNINNTNISNNDNTKNQNSVTNPNNSSNSNDISSENNLNMKSTKIYNDFEMNNLNYNTSLDIDKRTFCQIYISLIKTKQPIYYTFCLEDDYNSRLIKICLFLFSFPLEYAINALFFNDSTMHKIYEDRGKYNFIYQLPQIIYSFLISFVITKLLDFFNLSEEKISEITKNKKSEISPKINNFFKKSIFKLVTFFVLFFIFLLLFWYYLSSFCAVYKNTQKALIYDTIISFVLISLFLFPLIFSFIPCTMRYYSLRAKKKNRECLYKASNIISDIFL